MPFFSIIIPTLNASQTLERCLSSIICQEFQDFEILIMDGESEDGTKEIVESFQKTDYKRISFFQNRDSGVYDAMNTGLSLAKGRWIYFLGSDDWLYKETVLESINYKLTNTNLSVGYGNVLIHGDSDWAKDQEIYAGKFNTLRLTKKNICHQSIFYRASFLKKNNLKFDLGYSINADWDFNLKCIQKTDFHYLDLIIANFSSGGLSTNSKRKDSFFNEIQQKFPDLFPSRFRILASRIKKYLFKQFSFC